MKLASENKKLTDDLKFLYSNWQKIHDLSVKGDVDGANELLDMHPDHVNVATTLRYDSIPVIQTGDEPPSEIDGFDLSAKLLHAIVKPLQEIFSNAKVKDKAYEPRGVSPLHIAVAAGHLDLVYTLIARGASVNATDALGFTPFHYAVILGSFREEIIRALYERDADINRASFNAVEVSQSLGIEPLDAQVYAGALTPLHCSVIYGCIITFGQLMFYKPNLECIDERGNTLLHLAVEFDSYTLDNLLALFKAANLDITQVNNAAELPVTLAIKTKNLRAFALLLQRGVDYSTFSHLSLLANNKSKISKLFELARISALNSADVTQNDTAFVLSCLDSRGITHRDTETTVALLLNNKCTEICRRLVNDSSLTQRLSENDNLFKPLIDIVSFFSEYLLLELLEKSCRTNQAHYALGAYYEKTANKQKMLEHFEAIDLPTSISHRDTLFVIAKAQVETIKADYDNALKLLGTLEIKFLDRQCAIKAGILTAKIHIKRGYLLDAIKTIDQLLSNDRNIIEAIDLGTHLALDIGDFQKAQNYSRLRKLQIQLNSADQHTPPKLPVHDLIRRVGAGMKVSAGEFESVIEKVGLSHHDELGNNILHAAVSEGCLTFVQLLIQKENNQDIDIGAQNKSGDNIFHIAFRNERKKIILFTLNCLLEQNKQDLVKRLLTAKNNLGETPLLIAVNHKMEISPLLSAAWPESMSSVFNIVDKNGNSILHHLVEQGMDDDIHCLLNFSKIPENQLLTLINTCNITGASALSLALKRGYVEICKTLLSNGALLFYSSINDILNEKNQHLIPMAVDKLSVDVDDIKRDSNFSVIISVVQHQSPILFKALLKVLDQVNMVRKFIQLKQENGDHICHITARYANFATFKDVIEQYIKHDRIYILSSKDNDEQKSPLMIAAENGFVDHVDYLLRSVLKCNDFDCTDFDGRLSNGVSNLFLEFNLQTLRTQLIQKFETKIEHTSRQDSKKRGALNDYLPTMTKIILAEVDKHYLLSKFIETKTTSQVIGVAQSLTNKIYDLFVWNVERDPSVKREIKYSDKNQQQIQTLVKMQIDAVLENLKKLDLKESDIVTDIYAVKLIRSKAHELKREGFRQAFKQAIDYLFYVNLGIHQGQVQRAEDSYDSASKLLTTLLPTVTGLVTKNTNNGLNFGLAMTMVNVFLVVMKNRRDEERRLQAARVVDAFRKSNYEYIDKDSVDALTGLFENRYELVIEDLTVSISTSSELSLNDGDGVVVFARALVEQIGAYVMMGRNELVEDSNIHFISGLKHLLRTLDKTVKVTFGKAQDVKVDQKMDIKPRSILATWNNEIICDKLADTDKRNEKGRIRWPVHDILSKTAIIDPEHPDTLFFKRDTYRDDIKPIYGNQEEIKMRNFKECKKI